MKLTAPPHLRLANDSILYLLSLVKLNSLRKSAKTVMRVHCTRFFEEYKTAGLRGVGGASRGLTSAQLGESRGRLHRKLEFSEDDT